MTQNVDQAAERDRADAAENRANSGHAALGGVGATLSPSASLRSRFLVG